MFEYKNLRIIKSRPSRTKNLKNGHKNLEKVSQVYFHIIRNEIRT